MTTLKSDPIDLNLSHSKQEDSFEEAKQALIEKVQTRGNLPYVSLEKQLDLIEQLSQFELGRFLIERKGLNGFWTNYIISHPSSGRISSLNQHNLPFHPLEDFLLNKAPVCLATQQRFQIFKTLIQEHLTENGYYASVPCGLMGDLLELDFSNLSKVHLFGIDLDPETLSQARNYAEEKRRLNDCTFQEQNAWDLKFDNPLDLIVSNGLNIYVPDDVKVIELYQKFYNCLKPNGILITSFLTPPPLPNQKSEWLLERVNLNDALLQKIILADLISAKWQTFRSEESVKNQLLQAGFSDVRVYYDEAHIFPTVIAKKR